MNRLPRPYRRTRRLGSGWSDRAETPAQRARRAPGMEIAIRPGDALVPVSWSGPRRTIGEAAVAHVGTDPAEPCRARRTRDDWERAWLHAVVRQLPDPYRTVVAFRIFAGMSRHQVGAMIGASEPQVLQIEAACARVISDLAGGRYRR